MNIRDKTISSDGSDILKDLAVEESILIVVEVYFFFPGRVDGGSEEYGGGDSWYGGGSAFSE